MVNPETCLDRRYSLKESVRVRSEAFGALLFDTEGEVLYVVRPAAVMPLLRRLDGTSTLRDVVVDEYQHEASLLPSATVIEQLLNWGLVNEV